MRKKILATLLALAMISVLVVPVTAGTYDVLHRNIPDTTYRIVRLYHWVTRGEELADIAYIWGTPIETIVHLNQDYFRDLDRRNVTMGTAIQVEPGVRLLMHYIITARHYVFRGDTLNNLAAGIGIRMNAFHPSIGAGVPTLAETVWPIGIQGPGNPPRLTTTVPRIQAENSHWFWQLGLINATTTWGSPLLESFAFFNVQYDDFLHSVGPDVLPGQVQPPASNLQFMPGRAWGYGWLELPSVADVHTYAVSAGPGSVGGSPLFISVPGIAFQYPEWEPGRVWAQVYELTFKANCRECVLGVCTFQHTTNMPIPSNLHIYAHGAVLEALIGVTSGTSALYVGEGWFHFVQLDIPSLYGVFGVPLAPQPRYTPVQHVRPVVLP